MPKWQIWQLGIWGVLKMVRRNLDTMQYSLHTYSWSTLGWVTGFSVGEHRLFYYIYSCGIAIIAILAIRLVEGQLDIWCNQKRDIDYTTTSIPNSIASATHLFKQDPFQFEHWIVERVGTFPTKKAGDKGVNCVMYYDLNDGDMDMGKMIFSVKCRDDHLQQSLGL